MLLYPKLLKLVKLSYSYRCVAIFGIVVASVMFAHKLISAQCYSSRDFQLANCATIRDMPRQKKDEFAFKKHTEFNRMRFSIL